MVAAHGLSSPEFYRSRLAKVLRVLCSKTVETLALEEAPADPRCISRARSSRKRIYRLSGRGSDGGYQDAWL